MLEMMITALTVGATKAGAELLLNNNTKGGIQFNIGNLQTSIDYSAKLDLDKRNFHVTIDLDLNF